MIDAKVYSCDGRIVVEGADGNSVTLYDIAGRILATRRDEQGRAGLRRIYHKDRTPRPPQGGGDKVAKRQDLLLVYAVGICQKLIDANSCYAVFVVARGMIARSKDYLAERIINV